MTSPITTPAPARGLVERYTPSEAAEKADRARITIYRALESGELHGIQRKSKGRWLIRHECLEAWLDAEPCAHQLAVKPLKPRQLRFA